MMSCKLPHYISSLTRLFRVVNGHYYRLSSLEITTFSERGMSNCFYLLQIRKLYAITVYNEVGKQEVF